MTTNCYLIGGTRVLTACAARLLDVGVHIEGVLSDDPAAAAWAAEHRIPLLDPRGDLRELLSRRPFDYLLSTVNFRILPADVLALPRIAAVNFHDGPLPRYAGSHVPAWALYEGATRHAATWHRMTETVDAGSVLLERWFPIREHSTALSLTYETAETGIELFGDLVPHLVAGTLPEPVDTAGRERRFYRRSARMADGGVIHAGTTAAEAVRTAKALDYGSFPNPLGLPVYLTGQGAVFTRQVRSIPRADARTGTTALSVTTSALTLAGPDADLVLSDFTAVDGTALSGQAAAQCLGIVEGAPVPPAPQDLLAALAAAQEQLRPHEPWWRARLTDLRPARLPAGDFTAATAHYGRYELAFTPASREDTAEVVRAFLRAVAERTDAGRTDAESADVESADVDRTDAPADQDAPGGFDFAWSPSAARDLAERTHGLVTARHPVRFDTEDTAAALRRKLDRAAEKGGYAADLEARLGLAGRPLGEREPAFTRVMVLERGAGEEASAEPHTEVALLCVQDGPPTVFVRETAMDSEEALAFTERVEDLFLAALFHGEDGTPAASGSTEDASARASTDAPATGAESDATEGPTVLDLVAAAVAERPRAVAVRCGDRTLDYAHLDAWADAIAARLHDHGIEPGSVVGILTERGPHLLPALLGVLRAGAAFLPLDPGYPADRLRRYTEVARCDLVLTDDRTHALGQSLGAALRVPEADGAAMAVPAPVGGRDLAYVLFTSGSTGDPKGVEVEHGALANFLTGIGTRLAVPADARVLAHTTVAFDISLLELLLPLTLGATVVLASRETARDPHRLAELTGEVTVAQATPSLWRLLLETGWTPPASLTVLSGGEALPASVARQLHASARELWNLYGPTEATIWVSCHRVTDTDALLPLGEPLPNLRLHVLDERSEPVPAGGTGALYLSGAGLARGYAHRPDLTADAFVVHPTSGVRLYRTGDEVRLHPDGAVEWLGRADAQVKVRGNRIEPAEIERVLERFDGITAAVVGAARFEGRGEPRLTAYLVGGATATKSRLDAFVRAALPDYMVPDAYVRIDALPLTDNGKVARTRLPEPKRDNIVRAGDGAEPTRPAVQDRTGGIARVFAATLGHTEFTADDNFFDLGGDSASVTVAAAQLSTALGLRISAADVFATGTPAKLARLLGAGEGEPAPTVPAPVPVAVPVVEVEVEVVPAPVPAPVVAREQAPPVAPAPAAVRPQPAPRPAEDGALAVVGMACRFPGAATPDEFWRNLMDGASGVGPAPAGRRGWAELWSDTDDVPTGWLDGVEYFDPARFGLTDREARRMDPLQRLLLSVTAEALESCGHDHTSLGADTGVFVGTIASDFPELVARSTGHADPHAATGTAMSMIANRLSHVFDWSGPSIVVDTACSSSLVALHQAAMHLRAGDVDAAVVGAANLVLTPDKSRSYARTGMLSPQGRCRTFDEAADGYVRGEGCGVVVLKRLADAERDGDPVLAVIRGTAVNHTGGSAGFLTAPSKPAQEAVLRKALAAAGRTAEDIGYIEAHGTGTPLGDLIELEALHAVLGRGREAARPLPVGSVKTNLGHLEPAAGIAGLIKTVLALQAATIPPSLNYRTPNRAFDFAGSPLVVADRALPWDGPKAAGVSSFGFGGVNAHVVLEAAPDTAPVQDGGPRLVVLSAGSEAALRTLAERLVLMLDSPHCPPLAALSEAALRRPAQAHRLACVVNGVEQLDDKLRLFLAGAGTSRSLHTGVVSGTARPGREPLAPGASRAQLDDAARQFVTGVDLSAGPGRAGVRFPTAPHEERFLWPAPAAAPVAAAVPVAAPAPVPAGPSVRRWDGQPEAAEHLVLGRPTLPGAAYPGRVAELLGRDGFTLRDLTFRMPVEGADTLTAEQDGPSVRFRNAAGALVCDGEVTAAEAPSPLAPPAANGLAPVDLDAMYRAHEQAGLHYGPGYRTVTALSTTPGQAVGTLRADDRPYGPLDARLLDGAFQVALAACGARGLYVPFAVERLTVRGPLPATARVHARRDREAGPDAGLLSASLVILDGDQPVLEARGVTWKRISPTPPGPAPEPDLRRETAHGASATAPTGGTRPTAPPPSPRRTGGALRATLAQWVASALELDADTLEGDRPLQELGLDSVLAVSLAQDIRSRLDVDIPITLLLEVGTVDRLSAALREEYGVTDGPAEPAPAAPPERTEAPAATEVPVTPAATAARREDHQDDGPRDEGPRHDDERHDIAVIGVDGVFPNAANPAELWRVLTDGQDCLREVPASRWDIDAYYGTEGEPGTVYLRRAGFVDGLTDFDAGFFRLSPAEAQWIDPQQRHLIQSAWRALEDAGPAGREQTSTGVFVGASYQHYRDMVVGEVVETAAGLGNHNAILANRLSHFLDLRGPSMTIDTLCSSSLVALHTAVRSLRSGECEQAIVAGVHLGMSPQYFQLGSRLRSFSPSDAIRPFDAAADGFVPGEGVVSVVLKPLTAALRDGDRIRGVIRGSAVNHGGRTSGLTVPSSGAQEDVVLAALRDAGVSPDTIDLMEAHGTGTGLGDPIEVEGLTRAWRRYTDRAQFCALGSVKSNIGHLEPAAGLAGLVKVLLAMEHGTIPPSLHLRRPNDHVKFEGSPFYLADRALDWPRGGGRVRRAAVSAFGMGGVNAHVIVEEPPAVPARTPEARRSHLIRVTAADQDAVRTLAAAYADRLGSATADELGDIAYTANTGRAAHRWRVAVHGSTARELAERLTEVADGRTPAVRPTGRPTTAFLFTGQGSQYRSMASGLLATEPAFRDALHECADLLRPHLDVPLPDLLHGDARHLLDETRYAQPAIVSVQVALVRLLAGTGVHPDVVAGHSLGELTAGWAAGALDLPDLLRLTALRGALMQECHGAGGAMTVVHTDADTLVEELRAHPGVEIAAYNAPRVHTVTGPAEAVARYCERTPHRTQRLAVGHAFHSAAMEPAVRPFAEAVARTPLKAPALPFASTLTGRWHTDTTATDPEHWAAAIREPVRFAQALAVLGEGAPDTVWEVGPHPQLLPLARTVLAEPHPAWIPTLHRDRDDQAQLHAALATHHNRTGADLDWSALHAGRDRRTTTIPGYPFHRQELTAPPARRLAASAVGHPLFDRRYENGNEGQ
ncbi:amino acid adenylation domain-containing protein [Kitasatospora sp. NPDC059827]|uniref:amino acid adenylation domain-containing protein n=1 Tax=Kitasatospora sp. NPDC059827 TaxID=3346964 RepID=UPI00366A33BD